MARVVFAMVPCWGGPWCGSRWPVTPGKKVMELPKFLGEYNLLTLGDGTQRWDWWDRYNVVERRKA
jgi:hypothetical protein